MKGIFKYNVFKILEGESKIRNSMYTDHAKHVTYSYNASNSLYETNNMNQAYEMFEKMVSEGYRRDILFIVDFGVMDSEQRRRYNRFHNDVKQKDNLISDLVPYVIIGEFHKVFRKYNGYHYYDISISDGRYEKSFNDLYDALMYFANNVRVDLEVSIKEEFTDEFAERYERSRVLISDELLQSQDKYRGCKKIRIEKIFGKRQRIAIEDKGGDDNLLLLELHDDSDVIDGKFVEVNTQEE